MIDFSPSPCNRCDKRAACEAHRNTCAEFRKWMRYVWRNSTQALREASEARKKKRAVFQYRAPYEPDGQRIRKPLREPVPSMQLIIIDAREKIKLTPMHFGKRFGANTAAVCEWETGMKLPPISCAIAMRKNPIIGDMFTDRVMEAYYGVNWKTGN